ncbi:unnamed protein product [Mytilus edulis]|uniref:Uncharacterized protein n=1 Tax=Mytilus edulis TaxID=6550 RepID=A0A8S3QMI1_MYTED|nr:unnamed protein product [Mytilus edulis]
MVISPLNSVPKKDTLHRRVILDLSFSVDDEDSVNSHIAKDLYLAGCDVQEKAFGADAILGEVLDNCGLEESVEKAAPPSTYMVFLGILFDSVSFTLSITKDRWDMDPGVSTELLKLARVNAWKEIELDDDLFHFTSPWKFNMSNVRFLKGVRTRYRNSIQTEILNGKQILSSEVDKLDEQRFVLEATKCADKLKMYSEKLEIQSGKLASALEDEGEVIDDIVGEDCELCSSVMDCYLDLIQFKERLVDFIKKESIEVKENELSSQILELQREMKDIMQSQIKQQHEIFKKQS